MIMVVRHENQAAAAIGQARVTASPVVMAEVAGTVAAGQWHAPTLVLDPPSPGDTPVAPLRLTRRGRVVVATAAALLVTVVSLLLAGVAQATNDGPSPRAARQSLVQVVVHPGQSLWSVAESADPDQDPRAVIQQIIDLNSLNGDTVFAGQQLWVPRG